ncbi:hypothetical protein CPB84DRAFT_1815100 [Gymnopilus junonius]|uniref:ACB domain-containing protein n=1 Tax=Gymnopilus junonius TaxID=109634 RepID=A0A9P5NNX0_GYMJU|nr:hypothetical protein CPB84DRAFT_1815100 [Gymnopilus junonius]
MASHELINAQFDRAVEIVQNLPKTGPIQTDYEEKLLMYRYTTAGNVISSRPPMWDMIGRAKWDAWAKHKDLNSYEAKWLYVEALLEVLRKYPDSPTAMNLVEELESYGGDPSHIVMSRSLSKSPASETSGSTAFEGGTPAMNTIQSHDRLPSNMAGHDTDSTSDEDSADEAHELPAISTGQMSVENRPPSSHSSHRYRTPLAGSLAMSPPPSQYRVPSQQPLPTFETPSAFAESSSPSTLYPPINQSSGRYSDSPVARMVSSPHAFQSQQYNYRSQAHSHSSQYAQVRPPSAMALEQAVENMQVQLAALLERIETLESRSLLLSRPNVSGSPRRGGGSPSWGAVWDIDDLGMWSMVLKPFFRGLEHLREFSAFFASSEGRSPSRIIIRRLCLDVSFLVFVVSLIGVLWRRSGVRRREVRAALIILWRAIVGSRPRPELMNPGV